MRDSYHCGVTYGLYEYQRLYKNIIITDTFDIGVLDKAVTEAWSLQLARFKMHHNVYSHHFRNITDALLIEIISEAIDKNYDEITNELSFLKNKNSAPSKDIEFSQFMSWNDQSFIAHLNNIGEKTDSSSLKRKIESFFKREMYKRGFTIKLSEYPNTIGMNNMVHPDVYTTILKLKNKFSEENVYINFLINASNTPPVFTRTIQNDIKIYNREDDSFSTIAEYLKLDSMSLIKMIPFSLENPPDLSDFQLYAEKSYELSVFIKDKSHFSRIKKSVENELQLFSPTVN